MHVNGVSQSVIRISYQELKNQTPRAIAAVKQAFCNRNNVNANVDVNANANNVNADANYGYGALAIYDIQVNQSDLNMNIPHNNNNHHTRASFNTGTGASTDTGIRTGTTNNYNRVVDWKSQREAIMNIGARLALDPSPDAVQARMECHCSTNGNRTNGNENENKNIRVGPGWSGNPGSEEHSLQSGFYANMKNIITDRNRDDLDGGTMRMMDGIQKDEEDDDVRVWGDNRWPKNFKQINEHGSDTTSSASTSKSVSASTSTSTSTLASEPETETESNLQPQQLDSSAAQQEQDFETCVTTAAAIMHHVTLATLDLAHKAAHEVVMHQNGNENGNKYTMNEVLGKNSECYDDGNNNKGSADVSANVNADADDYERVGQIIPNLRDMAERSNFLPARLVYYDAKFSRQDTTIITSTSTSCSTKVKQGDEGEETNNECKNENKHENENENKHDYWLPWHVDFNLATAFAPAMWIHEQTALQGHSHSNTHFQAHDHAHAHAYGNHNNNNDERTYTNGDENPEHDAGLLLRTSNGSIVPAALEDDCILVQLGAHAQLATGGILRAGPHAVGKYDRHGRTRSDTRESTSKSASESANTSTQSNEQSHTSANTDSNKFTCDRKHNGLPYQCSYDGYGRLSFGLFVYGPWSARMKPSDELLKAMGMGAGNGNGNGNCSFDMRDDIVGDDFGDLMKKAYTGETVLEGYRKFETYMNGK